MFIIQQNKVETVYKGNQVMAVLFFTPFICRVRLIKLHVFVHASDQKHIYVIEKGNFAKICFSVNRDN